KLRLNSCFAAWDALTCAGRSSNMQFKYQTYLIAIVGLTLVTLTACDAGRNKTNVELIQDMMEQPNLKSQEYDDVRGESAMRLPPENTVPRGFKPYRYSGQPQAAATQLQNPYSKGASDAVKA